VGRLISGINSALVSRPTAAAQLEQRSGASHLDPSRQPARRLRAFRSIRPALLAAALLAALAGPAAAQQRSFSIDRFAVTLEVGTDATLRVREAITVDFRGAHQGLFRTIPVRYQRRGLEFALRVDDVHVFDENVAPLRAEVTRYERAIRIKAWVPGAVDAVRTVIITYRVRRALIDVDGHEELYWNVTGNEWDVPIRQVEAIVSSPAAIPLDQIRSLAYTGPLGTSGAEYTEERADAFLTFRTTRALRPREGLTIAVGWPPGAIRGPSAARTALWWLDDNWPLVLPFFTLGVILIVWRRYGRDPGGTPTVKPEYAPPEGMLPAAGGALVTERALPRDFVATLVDLAVRGYLRIEEVEADFGESEFIFHRLKAVPGDPALTPIELRVLGVFFGKDWSLETRRLSEVKRDYDNVFPPVRDEIYRMMVKDGLFPSSPEQVRSLWLVGGIAIVCAAAFIGVSGADWLATAPMPFAIGLGASGLIVLVFSPLMPRKTWRGAQAVARVRGFREFLERTSQDELRRLPPDTLHKWLAWAIALGVSERWIHSFDGLTVTEPAWYSGRDGFTLNTFDRSLGRLFSGAEQAILTSRRGGEGSWSGGGFSGGSSGGGMGGGGGGTF
jgi:uncharacterized membrane protein YgcG